MIRWKKLVCSGDDLKTWQWWFCVLTEINRWKSTRRTCGEFCVHAEVCAHIHIIYIILFKRLFTNGAVENVLNDTSLKILSTSSAVNYVRVQRVKYFIWRNASGFSILQAHGAGRVVFLADRKRSSRKKRTSHSLDGSWLHDLRGLLLRLSLFHSARFLWSSFDCFITIFIRISLSSIFKECFWKESTHCRFILLSELDVRNHENLKMSAPLPGWKWR